MENLQRETSVYLTPIHNEGWFLKAQTTMPSGQSLVNLGPESQGTEQALRTLTCPGRRLTGNRAGTETRPGRHRHRTN